MTQKHSRRGAFLMLNNFAYAIVTEMFARIVIASTAVSIVMLFAIVTVTSPATAGPFGLLLLFVSAYVALVGVVSAILYGGSYLISMALQGVSLRRPYRRMAFRRAYHFAVPLAAAPVMLIGLQSVTPIGLREFILVGLFEVLACIYVSKRIR